MDDQRPDRRGDLRVLTLAATVPLSLGAEVMSRRGICGVVVVDGGRPCGVLTEQDLLRAAVGGDTGGTRSVGDACCRELYDLVQTDPLVVPATTAVADAARLMLEAGVATAVAVGDDGGVRGVLTAADLAAAAAGRRDGEATSVADACVEVSSLSLDDGLEHALAVASSAGGRPVPVLDDERPVGTLQVPASPAAAPTSAPRQAKPLARAAVVIRRPALGARFYRGRH